MNDKFIKLTDKVRILNPCYNCDVSSFYGEVNNFNFEKQTQNYERLKEILGRYNMHFNLIWEGKFHNEENKVYSRFLVRSACGRIFWRKYYGMSVGSGQNFLYIGGKKVKTTKILKADEQTLNEYFNL